MRYRVAPSAIDEPLAGIQAVWLVLFSTSSSMEAPAPMSDEAAAVMAVEAEIALSTEALMAAGRTPLPEAAAATVTGNRAAAAAAAMEAAERDARARVAVLESELSDADVRHRAAVAALEVYARGSRRKRTAHVCSVAQAASAEVAQLRFAMQVQVGARQFCTAGREFSVREQEAAEDGAVDALRARLADARTGEPGRPARVLHKYKYKYKYKYFFANACVSTRA